MQKRTQTAGLLLIALVALLAAVTAYSQEDVTHVRDPAFTTRMRPPVPFPHEPHNAQAELEECSICHHTYADGQKVADESSEGTPCSDCHLPADGDGWLDLISAYHRQCRGCHQARRAGPVMCAECHPRID